MPQPSAERPFVWRRLAHTASGQSGGDLSDLIRSMQRLNGGSAAMQQARQSFGESTSPSSCFPAPRTCTFAQLSSLPAFYCLQTMANTVARAWDHKRLNDLIPPLTMKSSAEAWQNALRDRVDFAMLLKEHPNLFAPARDLPMRQLLATGANEILAQAATHDAQEKTGDGRPRSRRRPPILKSLIGDPDPFGATSRALVNVVQNTQVGESSPSKVGRPSTDISMPRTRPATSRICTRYFGKNDPRV